MLKLEKYFMDKVELSMVRKVSLQFEIIGNENFFHRRRRRRTQSLRREPPRSLRALCACGGEDWLDVCKPISLNLNK
jgi:hypothetical protein